MNNIDKTAQLQKRKSELSDVGQGVNARGRIRALFDEGSFIELGAFTAEGVVTEGVITGYGTVDGRLVYAYFQEFSALGGAIGAVGAKKVANLLDLAAKTGAPVVNVLDSNGLRIDEGAKAIAGMGKILSKMASMSGVVPQISVVLGTCPGGAVFAAGLSDFVFMSDKSSIFMTGPVVTSGVTGVEVDAKFLGGAEVSAENGVADFVCASEEECFDGVKKLLEFLPDNNLETSGLFMPTDDINRFSSNIISIIPDGGAEYDVVNIIREITDGGDFFEATAGYAKNMVTGFALLNGAPVGIVANQPQCGDGALNINACKKAAKFIRTCDSFNLPIVTFVDTPGFEIGTEQEHGGISTSGAALLFAYAEATVPKVTVVVRKCYGSSGLVMGSKSTGADIVLAYPTAEIAVMPPEGAANIIYRDEIAAADDPIASRQEKITYYAENVASAYAAAADGLADDVIEPESTRPRLISALDMLAGKREIKLPKKHGNMPV